MFDIRLVINGMPRNAVGKNPGGVYGLDNYVIAEFQVRTITNPTAHQISDLKGFPFEFVFAIAGEVEGTIRNRTI